MSDIGSKECPIMNMTRWGVGVCEKTYGYCPVPDGGECIYSEEDRQDIKEEFVID